MRPRGVDGATVGGGSLLGAVVLAACAVVPTATPPLGYARLALVVLAASAAATLDEPAAAAVDATPWSLRRRTAHRSAAVLVPLGVWTGGVLALARRHGGTHAVALLVEGLGVVLLAVALAAAVRRGGRAEPGEPVATGLGAALLAVLVLPPAPHVVPLFPEATAWAASTLLWAAVGAAALLLVVVATTDPALPRRAARTTSLDVRTRPACGDPTGRT